MDIDTVVVFGRMFLFSCVEQQLIASYSTCIDTVVMANNDREEMNKCHSKEHLPQIDFDPSTPLALMCHPLSCLLSRDAKSHSTATNTHFATDRSVDGHRVHLLSVHLRLSKSLMHSERQANA